MTQGVRARTFAIVGLVMLVGFLLWSYGLGLNFWELPLAGGIFVLNILVFLAVLALPVFLVIWLVESRGSRRNSTNSPLQIAEERYARGEINRQQFEEIRDVLSKR